MALELTVVAGSGTASFAPVELSLDGDPLTASAVDRGLSGRWPGLGFFVAGKPLVDVADSELVNGMVVVAQVGAPAVGRVYTPPALATLVVFSGPGAGARFPLQRGGHALGRGSGGFRVADPSLSRRHGVVEVGEQSLTIVPAPRSPGFTILRDFSDSPTALPQRVHGRANLGVRDLLSAGMSTFGIELPGISAGPSAAPQLLDTNVLEPLQIPTPGGSGRGRLILLLSGLLPLVLGVVLALLLGSWMFLAFAAMGAVTALVPAVGGRRRRHITAEAVQAGVLLDARRRTAVFPDAATLLTVGALEPTLATPGKGLGLRLGTSPQAAAIQLIPDDPRFSPPILQHVPVVVPLQPGTETSINGPPVALLSLLRFAIMQLDAAGVPAVVLAPSALLPLSARFLGRTALSISASSVSAAAARLGVMRPGAETPWVLLALDATPPPGFGRLPAASSVIFTSSVESPVTATVSLRVHGDRLLGTYAGNDFTPDGVIASVLDAYARLRGARGGTARRGSLLGPSAALSISSPEAVARQWLANVGVKICPVPLGVSHEGPEVFDFHRDGPHLLVAGTTGSGKSELLRTVVGGLAALHSPADLQFILLDFKGGAGLGVLCALPHTTTLVTDLAGNGLERLLESMRAEIRKREAALNNAGMSSLEEYRSRHASTPMANSPALAYLMIVIDEFRILIDQFPTVMAEIMHLAAVGRSLGVHLILATQRPQGALNADIRANVNSAVCLRVQSAGESQDVLGSSLAAEIAVDSPGRAFISRAGRPGTEFHSAMLALPPSEEEAGPAIRETLEVLAAAASAPSAFAQSPSDGDRVAKNARSVMELLNTAWALTGGSLSPAAEVMAPELPCSLTVAALQPHETAAPDAVVLGVVDVPERQGLTALSWSPLSQSHLACVGAPAEASVTVRLVVAQLLAQRYSPEPAPLRHLYLFDGDSSLAGFAAANGVGSHVTLATLRTAAHLVRRLTEIGRTTTLPASLLICITGWGRWASAFRSSPWPWAEDLVIDLARHHQGPVVMVVAGERELLTSALMPSLPNRIFLPHGSSTESRLLWPVLPRLPSVTGRCAVAGPIDPAGTMSATAYGLPGASAPALASEHLHCAQLAVIDEWDEGDEWGETAGKFPLTAGQDMSCLAPLRVAPLPATLDLETAKRMLRGTPGTPQGCGRPDGTVFLGVGGDGQDPVTVCIPSGTMLLVVGAAGAGKSTFLATVRELTEITTDACGPSPLGSPGIKWVDDLPALNPQEQAELTTALAAGGIVVGTAPNQPLPLARLPLEWGLRGAQMGIVLGPRRAQDGEFFGVRLDVDGTEPAGRAVLIEAGRTQWFQFPRSGPG